MGDTRMTRVGRIARQDKASPVLAAVQASWRVEAQSVSQAFLSVINDAFLLLNSLLKPTPVRLVVQCLLAVLCVSCRDVPTVITGFTDYC